MPKKRGGRSGRARRGAEVQAGERPGPRKTQREELLVGDGVIRIVEAAGGKQSPEKGDAREALAEEPRVMTGGAASAGANGQVVIVVPALRGVVIARHGC